MLYLRPVTVSVCLALPLGLGTALAATSPAEIGAEGALPLAEVGRLVLPVVDVETLLEEDRRAEIAGPGPQRFAAPARVVASPETDGTWEVLHDGDRLWRLRVHSPEATDLNFGFERFVVPPGAALEIVSEMDGTRQGPYTAAHVKEHGELWTAMVPGDRAVIELRVPADAAFEPEIRLKQISHGYRDAFGILDPGIVPKQGACNIDVVCSQGDLWRDQIQSVAVFTLNGNWNCTGTMLKDVPGTLRNFFLSANHCGINAGNAGTMVVYWNFESPSCGELANGPLTQNQNGASFLASWGGSDFALVELDDPPEPEFNVYWAGWDATDDPVTGSVGIHHPSTDEKAISFNVDPLAKVPSCISGGGGDTHWEVDNWEEGTTEPGSSGSALFDPSSQRVIGTLSGGAASCTVNGLDCYGRFAASWTGNGTPATRLSDWLDPESSGTLVTDGCYASARPIFTSHRLVDACALGAGDGNGVLEPGETAEVWVTVTASGDVMGVRATLVATTPDLTVTSGPVDIGDMASSASREERFVVELAEDAPCFSEAGFDLELTWGSDGLSTSELTEPVGLPLTPNVPLTLPNRTEVQSDLVVAQSVPLTDVNVRVQLAHGRVGHVVLRLRAPSGAEVLLLDAPGAPGMSPGGCPDDDMNVTFDDAGTLQLEDHCPGTIPWHDGVALPLEALSAFNGTDSAGTWTLFAEDLRGGASGAVVDWELITQPALGGACDPCTDVAPCPGRVMAAGSLRVRKGARAGEVVLSFGGPESSCATGASVFVAGTARPTAGVGAFPTDPAFVNRTAEDSDPGADYVHVPPAGTAYYLIAETLPTGGVGPSGHYGN